MKIKSTLLCVVFALVIGATEKVNGQVPGWEWAKSAGATHSDQGFGLAVDNSGNCYVTGYFSSTTITFGATTLTNHGVTGRRDVFIVKYDAAGNPVWARSAGSTSEDYGYSVAIDNSGYIYVRGIFSDSITFDSTTLYGGGSFVVKYDFSGNVMWTKMLGGYSYGGIATDSYGNFYLPGKNSGNIMLSKFDSSGNLIWNNIVIGVWTFDVAVDVNDNVYVTGLFDKDSITIGTTTITSFGDNDVFTAKYDSAGNFIWASGGGGIDTDWGRGIAVDSAGNCYITGETLSNSMLFGNVTLNSSLYIVKYDTMGNVAWARGDAGIISGADISTDANSNVYVTGSFLGNIVFGNTTLNNNGNVDVFVASFDSFGNALWATNAGGLHNSFSHCIVVDLGGNSYVTGWFADSAMNFGNHTLMNGSLFQKEDMFVAKLSASIPTAISLVNKLSTNLNIYPNPATKFLTIDFVSNQNKAEVTIVDITGKIIYFSTSMATQKMYVSTKDFAAGLYIVQVQGEDFMETRKIVVEK